jgi:hypothetical protein
LLSLSLSPRRPAVVMDMKQLRKAETDVLQLSCWVLRLHLIKITAQLYRPIRCGSKFIKMCVRSWLTCSSCCSARTETKTAKLLSWQSLPSIYVLGCFKGGGCSCCSFYLIVSSLLLTKSVFQIGDWWSLGL